MTSNVITPGGWNSERVLVPEHIQAEQQAQAAMQAQTQYRQFLASLAFELYSANIDPGMDERGIKETAGWALESAVTFIDAVNVFELQ